jgi:short subunit dehydrogenase-like uncharacterized protein
VASRIVLFGATGYTGRLAAESFKRRGVEPLLAARSADKLAQMGDELGFETAVADIDEPSTIRALLEKGDVLLTTVGPFMRFGEPAIRAAIDAGAHYLDSTGEPPFVRRVFQEFGPEAQTAGAGLLPAFGYDYVPGNLAGGIALAEGGEAATRVDVGYYLSGGGLGAGGPSGGTRASTLGAMSEPHFAWKGGRIVRQRAAKHVRSFEVDGRAKQAISIGSTEHFGLPRLAPQLRDVNVYLGWFGRQSRPMQIGATAMAGAFAVPGARSLFKGTVGRLAKGSTGGPDAEPRAGSGSHVVAAAYDADGEQLAEVHLIGGNGYEFTADILAWGAEQASRGRLQGAGALAPVDGFGLDRLRDGCADAGMHVQ